MTNKSNNYDSIAWSYDFLSKLIFFNQIKKAQTTFLEEIPKKAYILIIGGGTGYQLQQLLLTTSNTRIVYVEASAKMIKKAKHRIHNLPVKQQQRVEFIHGTEDNIPSSYSFNCICTHFFLDLFQQDEMEKIMLKLSNHSTPNAQWHFADFQISNSIIQKALLKIIFLFFKITTNVSSSQLPDYFSTFDKLGWKEVKSTHYYSKMIKSCLLKNSR